MDSVSSDVEVDFSGSKRLGADGWHALAAMELPKLHTLWIGLTRTHAIPYNAWTDWNGASVGGEDDAAAWEEVKRMFPRATLT